MRPQISNCSFHIWTHGQMANIWVKFLLQNNNHVQMGRIFSWHFLMSQLKLELPQSDLSLIQNFISNFGFRLNTQVQKCANFFFCKVEKILEGSLDSIPSLSPSVKIQIIAGWCQQTFCLLKFVLKASNVLLLQLKQTFPPINWIFI